VGGIASLPRHLRSCRRHAPFGRRLRVSLKPFTRLVRTQTARLKNSELGSQPFRAGLGSIPAAYQKSTTASLAQRRRGVLHRQHGAEAGLAVHNAPIRLRSVGQRIRFDQCFHLSLGHEVERFVKIFGAVLLACHYANASHEQIHERDGERRTNRNFRLARKQH
jgi:hypothetical protein